MTDDDLFCEAVRVLLTKAALVAPTVGLGFVREDSLDHVVLTYGDPLGVTAYRAPKSDIPEALRPRAAGRLRMTATELEADPLGLVQSRLLHTGLSDDIRRQCRVPQVFTIPVRSADRPTTFMLGCADAAPLTDAQIAELDSLAAGIAEFLMPARSHEDELHLLRRLEAVENQLLPALFRVLDVSEIFDHLSAIAGDVLRHNFVSLGTLNQDLTQIELYVQTSTGDQFIKGGAMPFPPVQTKAWLYRLVDDLTTDPLEREMESSKAGGRASLRVAVRLGDQVLGALNFTSRETTPYDGTDLIVARRIADYVALSLSHHRLGAEAKRTAELRAQAAKSDLLDEVLASFTDAGDLTEAFDRISREARKLLLEYHWPGNVRELRNIIERAAILCEEGLITPEHLPIDVVTSPAPTTVAVERAPGIALPSSASDLHSMERKMIEEALQSARFNKSKAAKALGLTRQQLYLRMRKYGLE